MKVYNNFKVGDEVEIDSWSSIGQSALYSAGEPKDIVTKIENRYSNSTGIPYKIMQLNGNSWWRCDNGAFIKGQGGTAYFVVIKKKKK